MKFLSLSIEHFRSFRARVALPFDGQGLVLVRGENRVSEAADSNGAGKSGITHALCWGLYGRDLDGLGADDVACRFTKDQCAVTLHGHDGATGWSVTRSRRPAGLGLVRGGETATGDAREVQERIEQCVGIGYRTFRNAVVFGQGAFERFAQADQAEQMRMLDEIQGLDFRAALERAKAWRDEWRQRWAALTAEVSGWETQRATAAQQIGELERALAGFRQGKAERVQVAEARVERARVAAAEAARRLSGLAGKQEHARRLREKWDRLAELKAALGVAQRGAAGAAQARDFLRGEAAQLAGRTEALLAQGRCPTCRAAFDAAAASRVRKAFAPDRKRVEEQVAEAAEQAAEAERLLAEQSAVVERHLRAVPGLDARTVAEAEAEVSEAAMSRARRDRTEREEELTAARAALAAERATRWDGQAALDGARRQAADAEKRLAENAEASGRARRTVAAAEYWVEAFGDRGLRSLLFDGVAGFLNERVAAHLAVLSAGEADVQVSALSALKGGTVKDRLSIRAAWGWGAGSYTAGSAGQDRRVDLALFAALQDLAERRSARGFPLKVWDEPGDALDARGKEIFCRWVEGEARARGTGLLITHSEEIAGMIQADRVWTVVFDRDGSRVEES